MCSGKVNYSQTCPWQSWVLARDGDLKELLSPLKIRVRLPARPGPLTLFLSINYKDRGSGKKAGFV